MTLAEAIHKRRCHWNHAGPKPGCGVRRADECGWEYETWTNPGSSRNKYLEKAEKVLKEVSYETAMKVLDLIK